MATDRPSSSTRIISPFRLQHESRGRLFRSEKFSGAQRILTHRHDGGPPAPVTFESRGFVSIAFVSERPHTCRREAIARTSKGKKVMQPFDGIVSLNIGARQARRFASQAPIDAHSANTFQAPKKKAVHRGSALGSGSSKVSAGVKRMASFRTTHSGAKNRLHATTQTLHGTTRFPRKSTTHD